MWDTAGFDLELLEYCQGMGHGPSPGGSREVSMWLPILLGSIVWYCGEAGRAEFALLDG